MRPMTGEQRTVSNDAESVVVVTTWLSQRFTTRNFKQSLVVSDRPVLVTTQQQRHSGSEARNYNPPSRAASSAC